MSSRRSIVAENRRLFPVEPVAGRFVHLACILSTAPIFTANCRSVELVQRKYRPAVERSCAAYVSTRQISMVSASTSASYHGYAPKLLAIITKLVLRNCSGLWLRLWCRRLISSKCATERLKNLPATSHVPRSLSYLLPPRPADRCAFPFTNSSVATISFTTILDAVRQERCQRGGRSWVERQMRSSPLGQRSRWRPRISA